MKDLTQGSITRHLLGMAAFIGFGLVFQTSYFLVDLYFVSQLGKDAVAGVSTAGSLSFVVLALSQIVGVGGLSLISQATGRKEPAEAILVYNQALSLSLAALAGTLLLGYALTGPTMAALAANSVTAGYGRLYLAAFLPSMAFMFPTAAIGSALRATGVVQPTILVQTLSVALNAALAPVLIAGWGTGLPLGVAGAGLASSVASGLELVLLLAVSARPGLSADQPGAAPPALGDLAPDHRDRPALGRRVPADVPDPGDHLLGDPPLRRHRAGRVRHRHASSCSRSSCRPWRSPSPPPRSPARISAPAGPTGSAPLLFMPHSAAPW